MLSFNCSAIWYLMGVFNMKIHLAFVVFSGFLISGCDGDKDINKVKSYVFSDIDNSRDLGTVMSHRDACKSGEWHSEVDRSGRKIVTYSCVLDHEMINNMLSAELERTRNDQILKYSKEIEQLDRYDSIVKDAYGAALSNLAAIQSEYDELKNPDGSISPELRSKIDLMKSADSESLMERRAGLPYDADDAVASLSSVFEYVDLYSGQDIEKAKGILSNSYNDYIKKSSSERDRNIGIINKAKGSGVSFGLKSAGSDIYFSSNPSSEQPVSFVGMKYTFNNNGRETSTTNGSLVYVYNGREMSYIKAFATAYLINR